MSDFRYCQRCRGVILEGGTHACTLEEVALEPAELELLERMNAALDELHEAGAALERETKRRLGLEGEGDVPAFKRAPWALEDDELAELYGHSNRTLGMVHDNASRAFYSRLCRALRELRIRRAGD